MLVRVYRFSTLALTSASCDSILPESMKTFDTFESSKFSPPPSIVHPLLITHGSEDAVHILLSFPLLKCCSVN